MCGRTRSNVNISDIRHIIQNIQNENMIVNNNINQENVINRTDNITPGMLMYIAYINNDNILNIEPMVWGFKMINMLIFNTQSETIKEKKMYMNLMKKNRGIVIIDGFYESLKCENKILEKYYVSNKRSK